MGATFATRETQFNDEATFAEYAGAPGAATFANRVPVIDCRTDGLQQGRATDRSQQNRANDSRPGYLGPREGSFEIDVYWCGYNASTATGALTATWLQKLLGDGLGGSSVAEVGGTVAGGATTTSLPFAAATLVRGGGIRVGAKNDGRADGQFYVIDTPITTPATLLNAMAGAPNAADVIYAAQIAYPSETLGASKRFLLGWTSTGAQYICHGCHLESATLRMVAGDIPMWTLRYRTAFWQPYTTAIPTVGVLADCKAAICTGGSVALQTVGTTTRALQSASRLEMTLDMPLAEKLGYSGVAYQRVIGFERVRCVPMVKLRVPFTTAFDADYAADGSDSVYKYLVATLNSDITGRSTGLHLPRMFLVGPKPMPVEENGLVWVDLTYQGREGPDTTNELTRSAFRLLSA